jgi:uncharacterized membrane protein YobD (UPF0266 family)
MKKIIESSSLKSLIPLPLGIFAGCIVLGIYTACANHTAEETTAWLVMALFSSLLSIFLFIPETKEEDTCKSFNSK